MEKKKKKCFQLMIILLFLLTLEFFNIQILVQNKPYRRSPNIYVLKTSGDESVLFNNFYYNWISIINGNPFAFYTGSENYSYINGNIYRCNETLAYQFNPPNYDTRDVNNQTRFFPTSGYWGNNAHDWVWIFKNTTLTTKEIPIPVFPGLEPEHLFNVTGESSYDFSGNLYDVWVLEDNQSSIAYYEKTTGILLYGFFYFSGTNTWEINMTSTNAPLPSNDNSPVLNDPTVSPSSGNLTTLFAFSVNYTDLDNNMPISINAVINGTPYPMSKQNPSDINYMDGVIYEYQTFLSNGTYNYFFNASDGAYSTSTGVYSGPTVYYNNSYSPVLSDELIYPLLGYNDSTNFLYRVNYSDVDNNPPIYVNLTINGTMYSMGQENQSDLNFIDGSFYNLSIVLNDIGYYSYNFTASDGEI